MSDLLGNGTPTTTAPATGGSFPQATTGAITPQQIQSMTPAQFFSEYHVTSSTDQALYLSNGQLNNNAYQLAQYYDLSITDRQAVQQDLVTAGQLASSDATGDNNSTALNAYKTVLGVASAHGTDAATYLDNVNQNGIAPLQQQLSNQLTKAQTDVTSEAPVVADVSNSTTLDAALTNAFTQTVGYAPDPDQLSAFRSAIEGQQVGNAEAGNEATRESAQATINQVKSEQSALNQLGPDGIDSFLSAYASAIGGTGAAGAGTTQGPITGAPLAPAGAQEGPYLPGQNPNTPITPTRLPSGQTVSTQFATENAAGEVTPAPGSELSKTLGGTHGGTYALSPALWTQAQKLTPSAQKYTTPGQAPQAVQQAAVTALASHFYTQSGSWSDVAISLAGGNPDKAGSEHVLNTSTNLQSFAEGVATKVNDQINQLQNQVNTSPQVTVKTAAPDIGAEANAAAKEADPVGYYAANYATGGSLLNQMLAGAPQMYGESTSDTFTGPVSAGAATSSTAPVAA